MRKTALAIILCAVVAAGTLSLFFGIRSRVEVPVSETTTSAVASVTQTQPTPQLQITVFSNATEAVFPTELKLTSLILNNNSQPIRLVEVLQTIPSGFNLTSAYIVMADGSRSECHPTETSEGLRYSLSNTVWPGEQITISVLLRATPSAAISARFTTQVRGSYNGKEMLSEGSEWIYLTPPFATCQDSATIPFGEFLLENSVWGGASEPHLQCIHANLTSFGWNVSRLSPSPYGLPSDCPQCIQPYYPEVIYGKKPWRTGSTTRNLPVALDSVESIEVSMAASMIPYAKYDLAFDIWITNSLESGATAITDEVMIWLLWTSGLPGERVLDNVNDGYNVYQHRTYAYWNMTRIEGTLRWTMHEFTIKKQGIPSKINILPFLDHLRKEKHDLRYLASIELGNEVWSGVGATEFTTYRIDLKTSANAAFIAPTTTYYVAGESASPMSVNSARGRANDASSSFALPS